MFNIYNIYMCVDIIDHILQGHGPECHGEPLRRGVSAEEQQIILDIHNRLRSRIATGKERRGKPGPQPGASNMKFMVSRSGHHGTVMNTLIFAA